MAHLFGIHVNSVGQISVDVWSSRRKVPNQWKVYFSLSPHSIIRMRAIYKRYPKLCIVTREWSPRRWKAYKGWCADQFGAGGPGGVPSLDLLPTREQ
jgi:hypothetical protein